MKGKLFLMAIAVIGPLGLNAQEIADIISKLDSMTGYRGNVSYEVLLPAAEAPVVYSVELWSAVSGGDPLSRCDYIIDWSLHAPSGESHGFSAYFDGHHYRYRDNRLQEYHVEWDSVPFIMGHGGVQRNAQFVELLPQYLADGLRAMVTDTAYDCHFTADTLFNGNRVATLEAVLDYDGCVSKEMLYVFDRETLMPVFAEIDNNPGAISEQTVTIRFNRQADEPLTAGSEEFLIARYPDAFEKYRESNFRVENLPGTPLPTFSLPTTTGERYTYHRGDTFRSSTVIAVMDPAVASVSGLVAALRSVAARSPVAVDVIYAFITNNSDRIEEIVPEIQPGEHLLMNARSLARDCGVSVFPTVIIAGADGQVKDVVLGFNKDLSDVVIQKIVINNN